VARHISHSNVKWQRGKFMLEGNKWDLISKFGVTLLPVAK
jgi:hypothetical protein